MGGFAGIKAK